MSYRERIFPSIGVSTSLIALIFAVAFSVWAALGVQAALIPLLPALLALIIWWRNAVHEISWDGKLLRVNQATIEVKHLSQVEALEVEEWRMQVGQRFNPAAFNAYKFWMKSGIRLTINDPRDRHQIWIVGSKRPNELTELIQKSL